MAKIIQTVMPPARKIKVIEIENFKCFKYKEKIEELEKLLPKND